MDSKTALTAVKPEETRSDPLTLAASTASATIGTDETAEGRDVIKCSAVAIGISADGIESLLPSYIQMAAGFSFH